MEETQLHFGRRVKYLRRLRNLTQVQLAEKLDLSVNYISQIETGEASPNFRTIYLLAQGLGVEMKELFDLEIDNPLKSRKSMKGKGRKRNDA